MFLLEAGTETLASRQTATEFARQSCSPGRAQLVYIMPIILS